MRDHERFNVLGIGVSSINMDVAKEIIGEWIAKRQSNYVTVADVNSIMQGQSNKDFLRIHNRAGMVTPDGMPLVWLGRFNKHKNVDRVYGPDLMLKLCEESITKGYRHYFYGGNEGVPELLKSKLEEKFPGIQVVGTYSPPFRPLTDEEDENIINTINNAKPDIVWVGLGAPKQERWMAKHVDRLEAPVLIGVGAAFDFHAGLVKQAPAWIQKSGFEWLFRLSQEPRRLWRRYLKNNPLFVLLIAQQVLGMKRYADEWLVHQKTKEQTTTLAGRSN
jgi:N-acetylglucosaminyldiphosphoundecaprenol N-acetyl-beta-D-mannosaminyltransferase